MKYQTTPQLLLLLLTLVGSCTLLGACGQKGSLYLPDETEKTEN